VGDRVYIKAIVKPGLSKKVQPLYSGSYRVLEKISEVVVRVQRLADKRVSKVHVDRIKKEACLRRGQAYNIDRAYPVHEGIIEEDEDVDDTTGSELEKKQGHLTARKSTKGSRKDKCGRGGTCTYGLRSKGRV